MKICLLLVVPCLVSGYYTPYHFSNPGHRYVNPIYPHLYSLSYLGARKSPAVVLNPTLRTTYTKTDIIRQTRDMANSLTATLRALAADPTSGPPITRILQDKDNVCLNSLDEVNNVTIYKGISDTFSTGHRRHRGGNWVGGEV